MSLCRATARELFTLNTGWEVRAAPQQTVLVPPLPLPALLSAPTMTVQCFPVASLVFQLCFVSSVCCFPCICDETLNVAANSICANPLLLLLILEHYVLLVV